MKTILVTFGAWISVLVALPEANAVAVVNGQVDNFEDGTVQSWAMGGPGTQPVNMSSNGPGGVNDNFLQVTSNGGGGGGSKLTVFNRNQWLGDYIGQGITAIEIDLNNLGQTELTIRIAFKANTGPGAPAYISEGFVIPVGSGWQHHSFQISETTMTAVGGIGDFDMFFGGGQQEFRIINAPNEGDGEGPGIVAVLGVDNIQAVPEPSALWLVLSGGMLFFLFRRRV